MGNRCAGGYCPIALEQSEPEWRAEVAIAARPCLELAPSSLDPTLWFAAQQDDETCILSGFDVGSLIRDDQG
jgi:hypothetical protein